VSFFALIPLLAPAAFAASGFDPDWDTACSLHCDRDGWTIEVLESTHNSSIMLRFWDGTGVQYIDSAHYQSGDHYLGYQSTSSPIAGGPYCTSYPGAAGHFILGNVYERFIDYNWQYEETGSLSIDVTTACGGSLPWLLDVLDLYGVNGTPLPSSCSDIGCASGGGVDPEDPGSGSWGYTDAANASQSFDDLTNDDDSDGGGGVISVSTGSFTTRTTSRSR
jgi:hypothetical protein